MVFDLGAMLRRKGEWESARLDDFAFRQRARAMRLLAARLAQDALFGGTPLARLDAGQLAARIAVADDPSILTELSAGLAEAAAQALRVHHLTAMQDARRTLIAEIGDPTPVRLG